MSWRRFKDAFPLKDVFKTCWSRRLYSPKPYVFRRRLQDDWLGKIFWSWLYVFRTSSIRLSKTFLRLFTKISSKLLQELFKMYHQVRLFKLSLWQFHHAFEKYCEEDYLEKVCLGRTYGHNIYGLGTNTERVSSLDIPYLLKQFF